jgi:hypothetical protein
MATSTQVAGRVLRYLGALAIAAVGAIHLQRYADADYSAIPKIGPLFLANAISSGLVALLLLAGDFALAAAAGIAIAIGSLVALFISESSGLFGFMEAGYGTAVVLSIAAEAATIFFLGAYLLVRAATRR